MKAFANHRDNSSKFHFPLSDIPLNNDYNHFDKIKWYFMHYWGEIDATPMTMHIERVGDIKISNELLCA